jgi:DHA1 family tetracycline resistance protein-like MFS transporter
VASRRTFLVVFLTIFLDLVGFGIIIPIQPFYAEVFGASPTVVTWLGASYSLAQFVFVPLWGRLSDRVGRRPVLLVSIAVAAVGYVLFGLADDLWMLFAARILSGVGTANIATAQAIVADLTPREGRAGGMALVGVAFGLGFIVGPAIGGVAGQWGLAVPAFVAAGLSALNLLLALWLVPETHPVERRGAVVAAASWARWRAAVARSDVVALLAVSLAVTAGFSMMEQVLGLFVERTFLPPLAGEAPALREAHARAAAGLTTWLLVVVGVTAIVVQGGLVRPLVRRFGEKRLLVAGALLQASALAAFPALGWTGSFPALLAGGALLAVGAGFVNPSLSALLSLTSSDDDQGGTLGLGQSTSALGRVLGPAAAGLLFEVGVGIPFWVGAGLVGLAFVLALRVRAPAR